VHGETDLEAMLSGLTVSRRPGTFVVATVHGPASLGDGVHAVISESEGTTVVAEFAAAARNGWTPDFEFAWLTLDVHSSLDAVGLTAAVSRTLAERGIACNVLAGAFHDHLLVPVARADDAIAALTAP
jgi:hypothetical protein